LALLLERQSNGQGMTYALQNFITWTHNCAAYKILNVDRQGKWMGQTQTLPLTKSDQNLKCHISNIDKTKYS
jgi:hypothetical protein